MGRKRWRETGREIGSQARERERKREEQGGRESDEAWKTVLNSQSSS